MRECSNPSPPPSTRAASARLGGGQRGAARGGDAVAGGADWQLERRAGRGGAVSGHRQVRACCAACPGHARGGRWRGRGRVAGSRALQGAADRQPKAAWPIQEATGRVPTCSLLSTPLAHPRRSSGIPVIVAAGNNQVDACAVSPASVGDAITVAASNVPNKFIATRTGARRRAPGIWGVRSFMVGGRGAGLDGSAVARPCLA